MLMMAPDVYGNDDSDLVTTESTPTQGETEWGLHEVEIDEEEAVIEALFGRP